MAQSDCWSPWYFLIYVMCWIRTSLEFCRLHSPIIHSLVSQLCYILMATSDTVYYIHISLLSIGQYLLMPISP
jgi:hypothetical protein